MAEFKIELNQRKELGNKSSKYLRNKSMVPGIFYSSTEKSFPFYIEKKHMYSQELLKFAEKRVMLFQIDKDWRDHLAAMDTLRSSVNLRAMGGKDPFYEYKKESFEYFNDMLSEQNEKVLKTLFNLELVSQNSESGSIKKIDNTNRVLSKKIGRNDPCPCGSGKKYKFCHGN